MTAMARLRRNGAYLLAGVTVCTVIVLNITWLLKGDLDRADMLLQPYTIPPLQISIQDVHQLHMDLPRKHLLPNYHNPCWIETLPRHKQSGQNIYEQNFFNVKDCFYRKALERSFSKMTYLYEQRSRQGQNWRIRCYPHYFLIGAPKSGTTDLFDYIMMHHHIVAGARKEPEFWNDRLHGRIMNPAAYMCPGAAKKGPSRASVRDYLDLYDEAAETIRNIMIHTDNGTYHPAVVGDHTPDTLFDLGEEEDFRKAPGSEDPLYTNAHYLYKIYSQMRLILILRDPVERAFSQYRVHEAASAEGFHEHVVSALHTAHTCFTNHSHRYCAYHRNIIPMSVRVGLYSVYVADWLSVFPRQQLLVLRFEDYTQNPVYWVQKVWAHIGLDSIQKLEKKKDIKNTGTSSFSMLPVTRSLLEEFYKPWNKDLAYLLADDSYLWTKSST